MKKSATFLLSLALMLWGYSAAVAQGRSGGKPAQTGRPAQTGLEHAETTANAHGQSGIENAESKQAVHKDTDSDKDDVKTHGKHKAKGKSKTKKH